LQRQAVLRLLADNFSERTLSEMAFWTAGNFAFFTRTANKFLF
jgi:hypothetical protein